MALSHDRACPLRVRRTTATKSREVGSCRETGFHAEFNGAALNPGKGKVATHA